MEQQQQPIISFLCSTYLPTYQLIVQWNLWLLSSFGPPFVVLSIAKPKMYEKQSGILFARLLLFCEKPRSSC